MKQIVECVPNFSEGRNVEAIRAIAAAAAAVPGVKVLDLTSDPDHNRSVLTFVGEPAAVRDAAVALVGAALPRIDLRRHRGQHPRLGAVDVIPFIPIRDIDAKECVALAREAGAAIADRFGIPVYLYEDAAASEERRNLSNIRKGEFEGLAEKMKNPEWKPDFGPEAPHETAGAVVVGARMPLIAYNVNLGTADLAVADRIAKSIRHIGGGFRYCKAMAVDLKDRGIVQVSINMTNYKKTPLFRVFECVKSEAARWGVNVVGSEIVGLTPAEALYEAAEFYLRIEKFSPDLVLETKLMKAD
ncbi:MAG TPA: glutamate formimidoyltransferase [Thermoanaerobaculia bacterium]|nr:glutamate formimidoyltransferase [Thermoanaerobaculia bacterium]